MTGKWPLKWRIASEGSRYQIKMSEEYFKEAREIVERAGYRPVLADIHLFCAEALLKQQKNKGQKATASANLFWDLSVRIK